jgi:hypothetical protein
MDEQRRSALLEGMAADAERLREEFLDVAGRQFRSFIDANRDRLRDLGGLVLIDDGPEYLSVDAEGHFSSRSRYQDEDGAWVAETEEIDDAGELVEIFNPAELYAAFIDAVEAEGSDDTLSEDDEDDEADASDADEPDAASAATFADEPDLADDWTTPVPAPETRDEAARLLYDLALTFQERSQWREAQLLDDFSLASGELAAMVGDAKIVEDEDERLWFRASGRFEGEVVPESDEAGEPVWQTLTAPDDFVQFYDPTDLFGDLAEALAERYPHVAPEFAGDRPDVADEG